jgi:hypothetical protein
VPHPILEPAERQRLVEGRSAQDRLGGKERDPSLAERSGHRLRRPRQPHEPPRRARREVEALHHVGVEAPEAELAVEAPLQDLAQDGPDLEVHPLEERSGLAEAAVEREGRQVGDLSSGSAAAGVISPLELTDGTFSDPGPLGNAARTAYPQMPMS